MKISNNFNGKTPKGPDRIKIDAKCPVCNSAYDFNRLEILQEESGATLMYIKCSNCQSAALSMIALGPMGIKMATALTDLEQDEVLFFQEGKAISSEDVLEIHEDMNKIDNWLEKII